MYATALNRGDWTLPFGMSTKTHPYNLMCATALNRGDWTLLFGMMQKKPKKKKKKNPNPYNLLACFNLN